MKKAAVILTTAAALALVTSLHAAREPGRIGIRSDSQQQVDVPRQMSDQMITAGELEGMEVVSRYGEKIGSIEEVKIDKQSGRVQFITISTGDAAGTAGEQIAAPLGAFEFGDEQARLTVDRSRLENVPQQAAETADSDYRRDLETHYGVAPAWEEEDADTSGTRQLEKREGMKIKPRTNIEARDHQDPRKVETQE